MNAQEILLKAAVKKDRRMQSKQALREGLILGIVYGKSLEKNIQITFSRFAFRKVMEKSGGEGTLIKLEIEGEKKTLDVIIQEVASQIYSGRIIHVDFLAVNVNEEVEVEVPITLEGTAPAVKDLGGILLQNLENVEVRCKAKDIPKSIVVNIGSLASFEDMIAIKDIEVPEGIEILNSEDLIIAKVDEPRTESEVDELEQTTGADIKSVEGVDKKPEEEKRKKSN